MQRADRVGLTSGLSQSRKRQAMNAFVHVVDRGGIDPPTFRFSGEQGYALPSPAVLR